MTNKKNIKIILVLVYLLLVGTVIFYFAGIIVFGDICDFYANKKNFKFRIAFTIILIPLLGYTLSLLLKFNKDSRSLLTGGMSIIFIIIAMLLFFKIEKERIFNYICKACKAEITNIFIGKQNKFLKVNFKNGNYFHSLNLDASKFDLSNIKVGDSVLVIVPLQCESMVELYSLDVSSKNLLNFNESVYYFKGKLYSKEEFDELKDKIQN